MIVLIRPDWREVELIQGVKLGDCVISSSFPDIARQIIPTHEQIENAFLMANLFLKPIIKKFGMPLLTSWIRSPELNRKVGGQDNSGHLHGSALDFQHPMVPRGTFAVYDYCLKELDWPGELFYYAKKESCHADMPRMEIVTDRKIILK